MKLYELFADKGFHTTVLTTFGIDFDAYENVILARLRASGCRNNIVLVDDRMLTHALSGASVAPNSAGRHYSVFGSRAAGVFHPKIVLQLGRRKGRLIVASANATASGLAGNLELAGLIECDDTESSAQGIVAAGWQYVSGLLRKDDLTVPQQIAWLEARTPWLLRAMPQTGMVSLTDGTQAAFMASLPGAGIFNRFVAQLSGIAVSRLLILSPYWDTDLQVLKELLARIAPKQCLLLIDNKRALFPSAALDGLPNVEVKDIAPIANGRFVHAKMILAQTKDADHVLYGSANCTVAALGRDGFDGRNQEVCLYRRLPPDDVLAALSLEEFVAEAPSMALSEIPPFQSAAELPLEELARRNPGNFECVFDELTWQPASSIDSSAAEIQLLKADGSPLPCSLNQMPGAGRKKRFQISKATARPSMARVTFSDGSISAPAVVALVDELRAEAREARTGRVESATNRLAAETEEGLWLLEVLNELEAAESETILNASPTRIKGRAEDKQRQYRKLDYEQFIAGRRLRTEGSGVGRNSLAGSEMSFVRAFLNRTLALDSGAAAEPDEEAVLRQAFDLGDDVADGQDAIERGNEFSSPAGRGSKPGGADATEVARRRRTQRRANRSQIINAVRSFNAAIGARAKDRGIGPVDLLRLRAVLTIVAASGWSGAERGGKRGEATRTSLQLLPFVGSDECWPRVLGQVIFAVFGGRSPAIQRLQIENIYDQIPDDVIECWATCCWVIQACVLAAQSKTSLSALARPVLSLRERVYTLTGLSSEELLNDKVILVMRHVGGRFAQRLGIDADMVLEAHAEYARILPSAAALPT